MNLEEFKKGVAEGKIKDKWYFYKRTEDNKNALVRDMATLTSFIKDKFNLDIYLVYGTLLGAIRENNFIEHDNDVDFAYLSKQTNPTDILHEFYGLCAILKNHDILSKICSNGHLHVHSPNKRNKFDLWTSYIINDKYYLVPLFAGELKSSIILPLKQLNFKNQNF
jgi:phosphorylcholine metabolism protein LicD